MVSGSPAKIGRRIGPGRHLRGSHFVDRPHCPGDCPGCAGPRRNPCCFRSPSALAERGRRARPLQGRSRLWRRQPRSPMPTCHLRPFRARAGAAKAKRKPDSVYHLLTLRNFAGTAQLGSALPAAVNLHDAHADRHVRSSPMRATASLWRRRRAASRIRPPFALSSPDAPGSPRPADRLMPDSDR